MKQMAATAGGVAIGSAVGHVAGSAITGMMVRKFSFIRDLTESVDISFWLPSHIT